MDSVRNNLKGKQVRITDEEGCNFVGMVEYVDQQRGKIGVNGLLKVMRAVVRVCNYSTNQM